jgi:hypothetical protein
MGGGGLGGIVAAPPIDGTSGNVVARGVAQVGIGFRRATP